MPYLNSFNVNEDLLEEVLRVKRNQLNPKPTKIGIGIQKTVPCKKSSVMANWFKYINFSLKVINRQQVILAISKNM